MEMSSRDVYDVLSEKGVTRLYHANSVITACQFLQAGALLSRGTVERLGASQTPQTSDETDKRYSLWFDVFADAVDIHERAGRVNCYGPVLFVLDAKMLRNAYTGNVWVTQRNPIYWSGLEATQRWFQSKQDLEENFCVGDFDHMIVFRHCGGQLPFETFLEEIIIDDPQQQQPRMEIDYSSVAFGALALARSNGDVHVPLSRRNCQLSCSCRADYAEDSARTQTMFTPFPPARSSAE